MQGTGEGMTDHAKLLEEALTRLIGEFYDTDTALNGYNDGVMARWIAPKLAAALETAQGE